MIWVASSRRDIRELPRIVQRGFGLTLFAVQNGVIPPSAKPLKGFSGAGVVELVENDTGGTYRAVVTVRYSTAVFVLHVFQKKSKKGIATPQMDMDRIAERLKIAGKIHQQRMGQQVNDAGI